MKNVKKIQLFITLLFITCLVSCSSSENEDIRIDPIEQKVEMTVNLSAILGLQGNDATAFVTFDNGQTADQHVTEAIVGDKIFYEIKNLPANVEFSYEEFKYSSGDRELFSSLKQIRENGVLKGLEIPVGAKVGAEVKFDIIFTIVTSGVKDDKQFVLDPKLKIRA